MNRSFARTDRAANTVCTNSAAILMDTTDWGWSPTPSVALSSWSELGVGTGPNRLTPKMPAPASTMSGGARKLVCARCRKMKEKCCWTHDQSSCVRCLVKGIESVITKGLGGGVRPS